MPRMTLNQMTKNRRAKFGTMVVEFDSPGLAKILKAAGLDFAFLDMEHSGFDFGSLKRSLAYMEAEDLPALVRVPSNKYDHIARALDIGAAGIMVPMVGSPAEARHIVPHHRRRQEARQVAAAPGPRRENRGRALQAGLRHDLLFGGRMGAVRGHARGRQRAPGQMQSASAEIAAGQGGGRS